MKQHKISLLTAILMNINIMVGSGILAGPGIMAGISGNASFLGWLVVALLFLPVVLSTVQMSRMCPGAGGFYSYAKEGLSKTAGYWSGWMYVVGYTCSVAVEILILKKTLFVALGPDWAWFTGNNMLFNVTVAIVCVLVNLLSLKLLSRLLNSLTISKMIPLIILVVLIPFIINPGFRVTATEMSALPSSLSFALFGYLGFEYCCSISHLVEDSERNAPLAILIGFSVTALIYMLFHFGLLNLMGAEALSKLGAPAFAQFITVPIPYIKPFLNLLIPTASAITLFAAANGLMNANAVMLHTMAEERLFHGWPTLIQTTAWYRPWVTIVIQGIAAILLTTLVPNVNIIGNLCILAVFLSFILPFISLINVQKRTGKFGAVPLTVIAIIVSLGLAGYCFMQVGNTMTERLMNAAPLFIGLLIGVLICRRSELKNDSRPAVV